jgi:hypothetical protein
MIHCITCKTIIPETPEDEMDLFKKTTEGHILCLKCLNPCGLDEVGLVYHHQCPDGCFVTDTYEDLINPRV